jgi:hypothetical protein
MHEHNIGYENEIVAIDGKDFNPEYISFNAPVPNCSSFTIYLIFDWKKQADAYAKTLRLLQCDYKKNCHHEACGSVFYDFSKFFDHIRSHCKERQFVCEYEGCN